MGITLSELFGTIFAAVSLAMLVVNGIWAIITTSNAYLKYVADKSLQYAKYWADKDEEERNEIKDES